ncbi:MAG: membrane protein insertion efficiency factor YidD [Pelagibacterales bacterium]|nr:membrane protein insertion efficiency factor YidD [Pelagibacterales bacterium]
MRNKMIKKSFLLLIKLYQIFISPYLGNNCRFYPSCSNYAIQAIEKHGVILGIKMSIIRVLRCNPWGGSGVDMVRDKDVKN